MADVFLSYSRLDGTFVRRLASALQGHGKDVWVDTEGIRDGEVFPEALRRAIESSDAFVFVISPDSVHSSFCEEEVEHAAQLNKRIVPLSLRPVPDDDVPGEVRFRNWIQADEDGGFQATVDRLITALDTDLQWERQHSRLTVKALEWDQARRDRSFLLRGTDLRSAEAWLAAGAGKDPGPTALETEYLVAARRAATRRQRGLVVASLLVAAISIGLLIFALISRNAASVRPSPRTRRGLERRRSVRRTSTWRCCTRSPGSSCRTGSRRAATCSRRSRTTPTRSGCCGRRATRSRRSRSIRPGACSPVAIRLAWCGSRTSRAGCPMARRFTSGA